jgi:hypothetical protein
VPGTLVAPRLTPRRNVNPAARRRRAAALASAFLLLWVMLVAALLIGATGHVRVPRLIGLRSAAVRGQAQRLALTPSFASRYDQAAQGTVIAQSPRPGRQVVQGSSVRVVLSAGPPPVAVPDLAGDLSGDALAALARLGLKARPTQVVAPDIDAGTVTSQLPAPGVKLVPGSSVSLDVAEVPHWQALTSTSGSADNRAVSFHVRGAQWRIVYTMAYQGTCTFIFFCSGPSLTVTRPAGGSAVAVFGLNDGDRQTRVFRSGPGDYRLMVSPGSDTARWSIWVQDYY